MAPSEPALQFTFINSTENSRTHSAAVRTIIRKHAMRDTATARKRSNTYGKRNMRQLPVFVDSDMQTTVSAALADSEALAGRLSLRSDSESLRTASMPSSLTLLTAIEESLPVSMPQECPYQCPAPAACAVLGSDNDKDGFALVCDRESQYRGNDKSQYDGDSLRSQEHTAARRMGSVAKTTSFVRQVGNLHLGIYERLRIDEGFDILNLSILTTLHLGIAAMEDFTAKPYWAKSIFRDKQWSYLSYLPSRYGHVPCLTHAADCVVVRLRRIMSSSYPSENIVLSLYVKALKSLQNALDDSRQCTEPETLCATELLTLFELFGKRRDRAWIQHAGGASRLIRHRGSHRFNTEFEKALFIAHAGPIVTEALLNNSRCFLEEPAWQSVFQSAVLDSEKFSDRSATVIGLWMELSTGPGMYKDATDLICTDAPPDPVILENLINKVLQHRENLLDWDDRWQAIANTGKTDIIRYCEHEPYTTSANPDKRLEIHGTFLSCLVLKYRILVSLAPARFADLEAECQAIAVQIMRWEEKVKARSPQGGLFMTQTVWVGRATVATKADFACGLQLGKRGMIERWKFEKWCCLLGRKTC